MKLVNSAHEDCANAAAMIKNILHNAYAIATNSQRWLYAVSALREEEQVRARRAATDVQYGCSAFLRGPCGESDGRGFNNYQASPSGQRPPERAPLKCHNCGSEDHFMYHCPKPRQLQPQYCAAS